MKGRLMKRPMRLVVAAVAGLWLWLFAGVMFGNRNFGYRDAAHFYYPLYQLIQNEWGAGRIPLWNPYDDGGQPLLANPTAGVLYPFKLIFALPVPYRVSYAAYILWHLLQALLSAAWVARSWGTSRLAAVMAGISFAFCGNVLFQYCNVVFLVGAAWLPVAWWCGERMLRLKSWPSAVGLGVCLALMVLGGDPQLAYVAGVSVAGYVVVLWWQNRLPLGPRSRKKSSGANAPRSSAKKSGKQTDSESHAATTSSTNQDRLAVRFQNRRLQSLVQHPLGLLVIAAISGGLLCAVQILPTQEYSRRSLRANVPVPRSLTELASFALTTPEPRPSIPALRQVGPPWYVGLLGKPPQTDQHHSTLYSFSVGPWRMLEYFFPNISGRIFPSFGRWLQAFAAESTLWVPSLYMGLIPGMLALLALRLRRFAADDRASLESSSDATSTNDCQNQLVVIRTPSVVLWLSWLVVIFVVMSFGGYGPGWIARCLVTGEISPACKYQQTSGTASGIPVGDEFGGLYWFCTVVLPGFVQFRFPAKMLLPAALGLSWLGAMQFDRVLNESSVRQRFQRAMRLVSFVGFAGTCGVALLSFTWPKLTTSIPDDVFWGKFDVWSSYGDLLIAFLQTALLSACCGWMRWPVTESDTSAWTSDTISLNSIRFGLALVLLTILDLGWSNGWMVLTETAKIWEEEPRCAALIAAAERNEQQQQGVTNSAAMIPPQPFRVYRIANWYPQDWKADTPSEHLTMAIRWEHDTLFSKYNIALGMQMINSGSTFELSELGQVSNTAFLPQPDQSVQYVQPRRGLDMWNVKYFLLPIHDNFTSPHQTTLGLTRAWNEPRWTRADPQGQPAGPPLEELGADRVVQVSLSPWGGSPNKPPEAALEGLGVDRVDQVPLVHGAAAPGEPLVAALEKAGSEPEKFLTNTPDVRVLRNPSCLPRAWIVHDVVGIPELKSLLDPIASAMLQPLLFPMNTYFDPRQTVFIESNELAAKPYVSKSHPLAKVEGESVFVTRYEPLEIVLEGEMKSPGAVVLSDVYYPGWNVEIAVNDAPSKQGTVCRANLGIRGVELPEGRFKLTFRYQPYWFYVGAAVSATAWTILICVALLTWSRRKFRTRYSQESASKILPG